jgi:glutaconyl-CoA decarboxylase
MHENKIPVVVNGIDYEVEIENAVAKKIEPAEDRRSIQAEVFSKAEASSSAGKGEVLAPMPAKVIDLNVEVGNKVKKGDLLLKIEAMKMVNEILAPMDGIIKEVRVAPGVQVQTKDILLVMSP